MFDLGILIVVAVVLIAAVLIYLYDNEILSYIRPSGRVQQCNNNAQENVRIDNRRDGVRTKCVEVEHLNDTEAKIILRSIDSPFNEYSMVVTREDFKHDPFKTLTGGMIHYWIPIERFPEEVHIPQNSSGEHPIYTLEEQGRMNVELTEKLQLSEARVRNLEANVRTNVDEGIENAALLSKSSKPPEYRK